MSIRRWFACSKLIAGIVVVACFAGRSVTAANNILTVFCTAATDPSVGTNYSPNITPATATGNDVRFSGTYGTLRFTDSGAGGAVLSFGTLNDLDTTQSLAISNNSTTANGTITFNGGVEPGYRNRFRSSLRCIGREPRDPEWRRQDHDAPTKFMVSQKERRCAARL